MSENTIETNKAVVRRIYDEVINNAEHDKVAEFFGTNNVDHERSRGFSNIDAQGVAGMTNIFKTLRAAFPDHHIEIEDLIAEDDKVVARVTSTGTHTGELLSVPGTGTKVRYVGVDVFQLRDGKVVEHWGATDMLGFLTQVGAWVPRG